MTNEEVSDAHFQGAADLYELIQFKQFTPSMALASVGVALSLAQSDEAVNGLHRILDARAQRFGEKVLQPNNDENIKTRADGILTLAV